MSDYPLFRSWEMSIDWILDTTERYPKSVRFSLAGRIATLSLDVLELIVEAIYTKQRAALLSRINLGLEKLRVLFRISYDRRYISARQYEHISGRIDEAGRMTGGWMRHETAKRGGDSADEIPRAFQAP